MKCPNCEALLLMAERQGIEIDYCPSCRGVWLDKGELDKMIEKSNISDNPQQLKQPNVDSKWQNNQGDDDENGDFFNRKRSHFNKANSNKSKGGFLDNLFDF